jgi:hypothetical protein
MYIAFLVTCFSVYGDFQGCVVDGAGYLQSSSFILVLCMVLDIFNSYLCYCAIYGYIIDKSIVCCALFVFKGKGRTK